MDNKNSINSNFTIIQIEWLFEYKFCEHCIIFTFNWTVIIYVDAWILYFEHTCHEIENHEWYDGFCLVFFSDFFYFFFIFALQIRLVRYWNDDYHKMKQCMIFVTYFFCCLVSTNDENVATKSNLDKQTRNNNTNEKRHIKKNFSQNCALPCKCSRNVLCVFN